MQLRTKDGWYLTEYTSKLFAESFKGTPFEMIEYLDNHELNNLNNQEEASKIVRKFLLGEYMLHPNKEGVIATRPVEPGYCNTPTK